MTTLYKNGKIYIEKNIFHNYMYVEKDTILKTGLGEPNFNADKIVDLDGKLVLPGFNDNHLHLFLYGEQAMSLQLNSVTSNRELITLGRNYLKDNPNIKFLYGIGWHTDHFKNNEIPSRYILDKISTDIPIMFDSSCYHTSVVNSKLLELINIEQYDTVDGGEIVRDDNGVPTGILDENAKFLAKEFKPKLSLKDIEDRFLYAVNSAISVGLTSVSSCDIMDGRMNYKDFFPIVKDLSDSGKMPLRYYGHFNIGNINDLKNYFEQYYSNSKFYTNRFYPGALKLYKDGSIGCSTALLYEPYLDNSQEYGMEVMDKEQMITALKLAQSYGARTVVHAIGDKAIDMTIDHMTTIDPKNKLRNGILHYEISNPEILKKTVRHKIGILAQPCFLETDIFTVSDKLGPDRLKDLYNFNTIYKQDPKLLSFGTDAPVEGLNPFINLHYVLNRKTLDGLPKNGFYPDEAMNLSDAIDAYTINPSYGEGNEQIKGRLKPGYLADFVILDQDIFQEPYNNLKDTKILATYIGGDCVYKS